MSIEKHDLRLLSVVRNSGYKYFNLDPGSSTPLRIPVSLFKLNGKSTLNLGIVAQDLINLGQPLWRYGDSSETIRGITYEPIDLNKLIIPDSVTKGDDGYYSVDYSKLDYTFQQFNTTLVSTLCLPN